MDVPVSRPLQTRFVEPEILDGLPPTDPEAIGSRRDLAWINALMLQPLIMRRLFVRHVTRPPRRILEIGAGDGRFMLAIASRMARRWPGVELALLDRTPLLSDGILRRFERYGWRAEVVTADVFEWVENNAGERFDLITANLFLHHFEDAELARLFALIAPLASLFIAAEPLRASLPLFAARLLPAIGVNRVTMHDAAASVRAGFRGKELSRLWPADKGQVLEERRAYLFTHIFAAATG